MFGAELAGLSLFLLGGKNTDHGPIWLCALVGNELLSGLKIDEIVVNCTSHFAYVPLPLRRREICNLVIKNETSCISVLRFGGQLH